MIGGYLAYTFLVQLGLPIWATIILIVITAIIIGLLAERLALRPLLGQPILAIIMMTIALSVVFEGVVNLIWGGEYKTYHGVLPTFSFKVGEISVPSESLIGIAVSVTAVTILMLLFRFTKKGLAMRATAEDLQVVQSLGIKATTVYAISWAIAAVVGAISGLILGGISGVKVELAGIIGLKAFAVVMLGGLNSIGGAIFAGIIMGILENIASGYLDPIIPGGGLANIFPFIIMIIVLIFKPHGLFGLARIERI